MPGVSLALTRRRFIEGLGLAGVAGSLAWSLPRYLLPGDASASAAGAPAPTQSGGPRRSDEMADMIGAVVHLTGNPTQTVADRRGDYLYSVYRDTGPGGGPGWLALLAGAGIRHLRCDTGGGIAPGTAPSQQYALETMRLLDSTKPSHSPSYVTGIDKVFLSFSGVANDLPVLRSQAGKIWMIEGPNESWPPNGKFLPSYVMDNGQVFMCTQAVACQNAQPPHVDSARWTVCQQRGAYDPTITYRPGDIVSSNGHQWVCPPGFQQPAGTSPGPAWWDLTAWGMPQPFSNSQPGIYYGYNQAGELGVAWGEFIGNAIAADNQASGGYWSRAGRFGGPTRIATWSEAGMDIYNWWSPTNDASLLARYTGSMPGGATNVHQYAAGQPSDLAAATGMSIAQANQVLPGYPIYLGEIGQATYPTDDALALGRSVQGSVPASTVTTSQGTFPVDQNSRPMPGSSTGRFGAELAQAQSITRCWAEMFRAAPPGSRLAVYELLNEPFNGFGDLTGQWGYSSTGGPYYDYNRSEGNFGLLRSDLSAKPAFTAIANVCQLMGDSGNQLFTPQNLPYFVSRSRAWVGAQRQYGFFDQLRTVLTQGSDGVYRIPIWLFNVYATVELLTGMRMNTMANPAPAQLVTLTVLGTTPSRMEAYNTQMSATNPVVTASGQSTLTWAQTADLWVVKVYP